MARSPGGSGRSPRDRDRGRDRDEDNELTDKLVTINRVAKVVKGGRRFAFAAIVVVGDQRGRVGHGAGKAREVPEAIRKATEAAKRNLIRVPLRDGRTLHHDVKGRFGAGKVTLRSAPAGTGIIAGGPMRAVFETLGLKVGIIRETAVIKGLTAPADGKGMLYGLGLATPLNFSDPVQTQHALAQVSSAMGTVRSAYRDLVAAATPRSAVTTAQAKKAGGPVPQYLLNQIASYQAALARLTGGG